MQPYSLYTGPPPSAGPVLLDPMALQGQILTPPLLPWQKAAMAQQATNMQEQVRTNSLYRFLFQLQIHKNINFSWSLSS